MPGPIVVPLLCVAATDKGWAIVADFTVDLATTVVLSS